MTVLIIEELTMVSESLAQALATRHIEVMAQLPDARNVLDYLKPSQPDVVIWDVPCGTGSCLATIEQVHQAYPEIGIVLLVNSDIDPTAAIRAGASALVLKSASLDLLVRALESVMIGEQWIQREFTNDLFRLLREQQLPRDIQLSARQVEILRLVAQGLRNTEIADQLCVSEYTIKSHVNRILKQLGIKNRVEATLWALDNGIVDDNTNKHTGSPPNTPRRYPTLPPRMTIVSQPVENAE